MRRWLLVLVLALAGCSGAPTNTPVPGAGATAGGGTAAGGSGQGSPTAVAPSALPRATVAGPVGLATTSDAVWVASSSGDAVLRLDPTSLAVTRSVPVGRTPLRLTVDRTLLWASVFGANELVAVNMTTGT